MFITHIFNDFMEGLGHDCYLKYVQLRARLLSWA